jgi:hypothetical protein
VYSVGFFRAHGVTNEQLQEAAARIYNVRILSEEEERRVRWAQSDAQTEAAFFRLLAEN